jgi:hypothetical protein
MIEINLPLIPTAQPGLSILGKKSLQAVVVGDECKLD